MIIRYTVYDNDYTNTIKSFYKHIKFDSSVWLHNNAIDYKDEKQLKEAVENQKLFEELFKKCLYHKGDITVEEIHKLNELLYHKFSYYLKTMVDEKLVHEMDIEIVPSVADVDRNGEYIYYFVGTDQIVVL